MENLTVTAGYFWPAQGPPSGEPDLAGIGKKYGAQTLRANTLRPSVSIPKEGVEVNAWGQAHQKTVENISPQDAQNLLAYLQSL